MAKKRRKQTRSRNRPPSAGTRTATRPRPGTPTETRQPPEGDGPNAASAGGDRATPTRQRPAARPRPQAGQRSRAEKKELARRERDAARRRLARARRRRQLVWVAGLALVVAAGVFVLSNRDEGSPSGPLPGELTTEAPWDANGAESDDRADALGLPPEGTTMHEHANVQVFVDGTQVPVPTDVGIDPGSQTISSIHTHDDTGTVHLESSVSREFTLDEFFGVWGVRLTPSCLGAYCNEGNDRLRVFVGGEEATGDPQDVQLDDQSVVVVTYGTEKELPDPIPSTFDFSSVPQ